MRRNLIETIVAAMVLLIAGAFALFVVDQTRPPDFEGYALTARFADAPTLRPGAEVRIAGVAVGRVSRVELDGKRFDVEVEMVIRPEVALASDTKALLTFDGLLGNAVIALTPGRSDERLAASDRIRDTESPTNVVDQFGRFLYGDGGDDDDF